MPFASQAQARFMFANHPAVAREFASKTPNIKALPQHVSAIPGASAAAKAVTKKKKAS